LKIWNNPIIIITPFLLNKKFTWPDSGGIGLYQARNHMGLGVAAAPPPQKKCASPKI